MTEAANQVGQAARDCDAGLDWKQVQEEAIDVLRDYLRFPTVNDPDRLDAANAASSPWLAGNEADAVQFLAARLEREGVSTEVIEAAPGRQNLLVRLRGDGSARSVVLLSHSDVVPASRADWKQGLDPFGAEVHDGFLYGRGALDLKGLGVAHLMTLLLLHRKQVPLRSDVVALVVADEEAGGRFGAEWLLARRPELLDARLVLGEGAYSPAGLVPGVDEIQAFAVGEKGALELELKVEAQAHHASMPMGDSAPARLFRAIARVMALPTPVRLTPPSEALIRNLAETTTGLHRWLFRRPHLAARFAQRTLTRSNIIGAMLKDTIALTVLESGYKSNVIPGDARAIVSIRFLPGTSPDQWADRIRRAVADPDVKIRRLHEKPANLSRSDTKELAVLARHATSGAPGSITTPILSPGASDGRHFRAAGTTCYGWVPFRISGADLHGVHGPDERVSLDAVGRGLRMLHGAVAELAVKN